jgi:hypothetical protein
MAGATPAILVENKLFSFRGSEAIGINKEDEEDSPAVPTPELRDLSTPGILFRLTLQKLCTKFEMQGGKFGACQPICFISSLYNTSL